jgi:hypothetical protein
MFFQPLFNNKRGKTMKKYLIILLIVCAGVLFAQTGYVHNTNTVTCGMADNGVIGDNGSGSYGGLTYLGGSNAIYSGGLVVTVISATGTPIVSGMCASYNLNDFVNAEPFSGFTSDANFDTIGSYVYTAQYAPGNSIVYTYSRNDQSVIYLRQKTRNVMAVSTNDFHIGIIIDFDIGDYANNSGGYDPSRNLIYMFDASASPSDTNFYGVVLLNVPPNSLHGKLIQNYSATNQDVANYCINTDFSTPPDTADHRLHISMPCIVLQPGDLGTWDFAIVCGTSLADLQNTVDNTVVPYGVVLPVELTSFTAVLNGTQAVLQWTTASELNNHGFEIERKINESNWNTIGFKEGFGTTTEKQNYTFVDDLSTLANGTISYRLKQVDFGGNFEYSDVVDISSYAASYELSQNYPNPFNPNTSISYSLLEKGFVTLSVYNNLGEEVAVLVNKTQESGKYKVEFDASKLPSGVYIYSLNSGAFFETKKMLFLK